MKLGQEAFWTSTSKWGGTFVGYDYWAAKLK
jgi:hypothetical protein